MDREHKFYVVDVFANKALEGNQLAVVLDCDDADSEELQKIALEMNYAETTFVSSTANADGSFPVRIFTPSTELPFAGHPTLGTSWVIRQHIATGRPESVQLDLKVGKVDVAFKVEQQRAEIPWFTAPKVEFGPIIEAEEIAGALSLSVSDIDTSAPIQQLSAGIVINCIPVVSLQALNRAQLNLREFESLSARGFNPFVHLFCTETLDSENDICARFFFDAYGVREDSATGSATACLGAYLLETNYLNSQDLNLKIEQGARIDRPSFLHLKARMISGEKEVQVGGNVIETMSGVLYS